MAICMACKSWIASNENNELCEKCKRAIHQLNGYAIPVSRGRWKLIEDCWAIYQCSCCKEEFVTEDGEEVDELWKYCPNCGAKMDG